MEEALAAALRAERDEMLSRLAALDSQFQGIVAATADANTDDEHDPEGATIAFERSQVAALAAQARRRIAEVEAALERVAAGSHGVCADCGGPIGAERLAARPSATRCIGCASSRRAGR